MELTEAILEKLHRATFWHLVTLGVDGIPHVRPVWVDEEEGFVLVNSGLGWRKEQNARANPQVVLSMLELDNPYDRVELLGRAVDFVSGPPAEAQLDRLAYRYLGLESYPWRKPHEKRVIIRIEPERVVHHRDTDDPAVLPVA